MSIHSLAVESAYGRYVNGDADTYLSDFLHTLADEAIPVYTGDIIDAYRECPDVEPEEPAEGIIDGMIRVVYDSVYRELTERIWEIQDDVKDKLTEWFDAAPRPIDPDAEANWVELVEEFDDGDEERRHDILEELLTILKGIN